MALSRSLGTEYKKALFRATAVEDPFQTWTEEGPTHFCSEGGGDTFSEMLTTCNITKIHNPEEHILTMFI
jgi:hypothetical protein